MKDCSFFAYKINKSRWWYKILNFKDKFIRSFVQVSTKTHNYDILVFQKPCFLTATLSFTSFCFQSNLFLHWCSFWISLMNLIGRSCSTNHTITLPSSLGQKTSSTLVNWRKKIFQDNDDLIQTCGVDSI